MSEGTKMLARIFAEELQRELGDRWSEFLAKQAHDWDNTCSSHDFCDANMTMSRAYEIVYGESVDIDDDLTVKRWNEAWDIAAKARFTFTIPATK
jgi:hypothetical protein